MAEEIKVVIVGEQGPSGQGVPNLGTTGQYLRKASDTDFDTEWTDSSVSIPGLNDVDDVTIVAAVEGQVLTFDGTNWVNQDGVAVANVADIGDVVITNPQHRDVLVYDGGLNVWENQPVSTGGGSGTDNHSALLNLGADDHTQYHNDARGDIRYYLKSEVNLALVGKSNVGHTHVEADITNLDKYTQLQTDNLLATKAASVHTHVINDVTGLQTSLDGKANTGHTHVEADIDDLDKYTQAEVNSLLSGKADSVHTHVIGDVIGLQTSLDGKASVAQGNLADTSVQPGDNLSVLNDDLGLVFTSDLGVSVATLAGGKIPVNQLPNISITDTFVVTSEVAMLALSVQTGDVAIRTDLSSTFILQGTDPTLIGSWVELATPTDTVTSVDGRTGTITLTDLYEPLIGAKGTAFNKNFGTASGTVAEGNDSRLSDARTPLAHTHIEADILDLDKYTQSEVNILLSNKADNSHNHVITDVTGLQSALDAKSDNGHTHVKADITDFNEGDYATSAQGLLADSASQPGDNLSSFVDDIGLLVSNTGTATTSGTIPQILIDVPVPNNEQRLLVVSVRGKDLATGDMYWKYTRLGAKTIANTTTLVGGVANDLGYDSAAAAWTAVASTGSGNISIVVTGELGKTIQWTANVEIK
jgi:hypothetical protein